MAKAQTSSLPIAEMREFASFSAEEQCFIARSLDIALHRGDAFKAWGHSKEERAAIRRQYIAYRGLAALREAIPCEDSTDGLADLVGPLVRLSALDLAHEELESFSAYRFLYERLLGGRIRPWLPAAFCGAAALPQIRPCRRKLLLQSLSESAATASGWSTCEASFFPGAVDEEAA